MSLIPKKPRNNDSICYPIIQTETTIDGSDCKSMKDGCIATHRMINALIYYSTLNINMDHNESVKKSNENNCARVTMCIQLIDDLIMIFKDGKESNNIKQKTDKDKFIKYITETYTQFLNDYIHIMDKHNNDIEEISESMVRDFSLMNTCDIKNCSLLRNHFRDRNYAKNELKADDINMTFYIDIMNCMHCHLYHLYDIGMRVKMDEKNKNIIINNNNKIQYFDA
eukprot:16048_1